MIHLKGRVEINKLFITDSFVDFTLFTVHPKKSAILQRAAIIPLEVYESLLQEAEDYEQLTILKPLADFLKQQELQRLDEAQKDKSLLEGDKNKGPG